MLARLRWWAADTVRRSALGLAGGLLLVVGAGFATVAAWTGLAAWGGPAAAALVLAAVYGGLGLLLLALARPAAVPPPLPDPTMGRVAAAFMDGVEAGLSVRRGRPAPPV